jgi:hypothetical protein
MSMIADRMVKTRAETWQDVDDQGRPLHRTLGFASLGGATLDNEENYLIKKLFTALGAIQIENQAVFDTPPRCPVWAPPSAAAAPRTSSRTSPTRTA